MRFVLVDKLKPGMVVGRDIISKKNARMITQGMELTAANISYLASHGYSGVYVADEFSKDIEVTETVSEDVFRKGVSAVTDENLDDMIEVATQIVSEILKASKLSVEMIDLRGYDDYTYHHSVNVAVYAVSVGRELGLSDTEIGYLSQAAICHDLGKMMIPKEILNKPGVLNDAEYEIVKKHPRYSYEMLELKPSISSHVKQAVLWHHENENGSGYPMKKTGEELSILAKILHAVDVFDALTSKRVYKDAYTAAAAFEYLKGGCEILFDKRVVEAMTKVIPIYPSGIEIELSDGRTGVVIRNTNVPERPVVKLFGGGVTLDLSEKSNSSLFIKELLTIHNDFSKNVEALNENRGTSSLKKKVLVIDDMLVAVMQTKAALGNKYNVITATSAAEALAKIDTEGRPDLFIVDIEMPVVDGFDFVKAVKRKGYSDIPIMFLTARVDKATVLKCIELGAVDYITKPAKPVYIRERVAIALNEERE